MKETTLKLKRYVKEVKIIDRGDLRRRVFFALLGILGSLGILYAMLMGNLILNIVERRAFTAEERTLRNDVGILELNYLTASSGLTLDMSMALGFENVKQDFTDRHPLGALETIIDNEL